MYLIVKILLGFAFVALIANVMMVTLGSNNEKSVLGDKEVTYEGVGEFTNKGFWDPIFRPILLLPQSPETINTRFMLYTIKNKKSAQFLKIGDRKSLEDSSFNAKSLTKFIIHGFVDNIKFIKWMVRFKDEFLKANDYNVIVVDWSDGNCFPYTQATANTRVVGAVIALLINDLKSVFKIDLSTVHILGHSLGAHIAGYAGEKLKGKLGRITGLDPAGPYFEGLKDPVTKLDPTDAQFVDVIHSDAKLLVPTFGFGIYETCGHLDFYPNGGKNQPGCIKDRFTSITNEGLIEGGRLIVACNHQRAVEFYISSINYKKGTIIAYQCEDYDSFINGKCSDCGQGEKCAILGDEADQSRKFANLTIGTRFYLKTSAKYPYFIK